MLLEPRGARVNGVWTEDFGLLVLVVPRQDSWWDSCKSEVLYAGLETYFARSAYRRPLEPVHEYENDYAGVLLQAGSCFLLYI